MQSTSKYIIIGGLGGGGDVGLAFLLARTVGVPLDRIVVASFHKCTVNRSRLEGIAVRGALIRIPKGYFPDKRVFEDKLPLIYPELEGRIYAVCTRDTWREMMEGLTHLIDTYKPSCMLHTDLGGDGLVTGYEDSLGSYKTDTMARSLLAHTAGHTGVRSILAVGCTGCEGGGGELSDEWLAATLLYAEKQGVLIGVIEPSMDYIGEIEALLTLAESGMLPYYLAALRGKKTARISMAYLRGEYQVKPWHKLVYLLDTAKHCSISPICRRAPGRGAEALRNYEKHKPKPPRELRQIYVTIKRRGANYGYSLLDKRKMPVTRLVKLCG